jgi:PH (Pleckstrin Homology) domain-containing protein
VTPGVVTEGATTVFRPRRARLVIYPCAALVLAALIGGAVFAPSGGAGGWSVGSRLALCVVALAVAYFLHRLAAVRVVADDAGVSVINIVHRRRLEWPEVVGVRLLRDDPWMMLDLSDGSAMAAMGVQKADGAHAQEQAEQFARMVAERTRAPGGH